MITKYTEYIKESLNITQNTKFIENILKRYEINGIEYEMKWLNVSKIYQFHLYFNGVDIIHLEIAYISKLIVRIYFFDQEDEIIYDRMIDGDDDSLFYEEIEKTITNYLDNYYKYFLEYEKKYNFSKLNQVPVINIEKYLDFLEDVFKNYKKYEIFDYDNPDYNIIEDFINSVYYNEDFFFLEEYLDKRFGYLINASNFDLI